MSIEPLISSDDAAALLNAPGGVPPEWISGVDRLLTLPCPGGVAPSRWCGLINDARAFIETWGPQAARLGWSTTDVFGVNRAKPFRRADAAGLVLLLDGRPVAALTEASATIECGGMRRLTYRRKPPGEVREIEQCLLWELSDDGERK